MKKRKTLMYSLLLLFSLAMLIGCADNQVPYDSGYDDLLEQYNLLVIERDSAKSSNTELEAKNSELTSDIEVLSKQVDELSTEVITLTTQLDEKTLIVNEQNERLGELQPYLELSLEEVELRRESLNRQEVLDDLDSQVEAKQQELDELVIRIRETGEAPITLGAGEYRSPDDIPPGRYTVTGSSNFFVYNSSGRLQVNTILGGRRGEDSYTFWLESGGTVEARGRFTLTPVE